MSPGATNTVVALGREAGERAGKAPAIARRPTLTSGELLLRCAVHLSAEAHDIVNAVRALDDVPGAAPGRPWAVMGHSHVSCTVTVRVEVVVRVEGVGVVLFLAWPPRPEDVLRR